MNFKTFLESINPFHRKDSRARTAIAFHQLGQPQMSPRNYDNFSREGYQKNVIAFRAVTGIAMAAKGIPWTLFSKRGSRKTQLDDHELLTLLNIRPNPMQGGAAFRESMVAYYFIAGNSFIEATRANSGPPRELWSLRPDRFQIVPGVRGLPQEYRFRAGGKEIVFEVDQIRGDSPILHLKTFHPLNDWWGMSPIEAAASSIDQHNESGIWNLALLQNKATPSGALVVAQTDANPSGKLEDETFTKLKKEIKDKFSGSRNAGVPLLLEGGLDWKEMSINPKDMDWIQGKNISAREVALAFGYPPILLSIQGDSTFANVKEARLALYEDTVLPTMDFIRDEFNNWLVPAFGDDLFLDYDRDSIPALAIKRQAIFDRVNTATFLTINEKRDATDFEPVSDGDTILVPAGLIPLELAVESFDDEPVEPDDDPDDESDDNSDDNNPDENTGHLDDEDKSQRTPLQKQIDVRFDDFVKRWVDNNVGIKITNIKATSKKRVIKAIRNAVADNLAEGGTLAELTNRIQKDVNAVYSGFTKGRSRTIARTETVVASNEGSRGAAKALNIPNLLKEWISDLSATARGRNPKDSTDHVSMNGTKVELNEKFIVPSTDGFDEMVGPGDPSAPADQVINCKCVTVYNTPGKSINVGSAAAKRRFWLKTIRERQRVEKRFESQVRGVFRKELETLIDNLKNVTDIRLAEIIIDQTIEETSKLMEQVLRSNETDILNRFGTDVLRIGEDT